GVGAVEGQRVEAVAAVDGVAAVTGVPDEGVVAGAAGQGVVAGAAVDGQLDMVRGQARGVQHVVAAEGVHLQDVEPPLRVADSHGGHLTHGGVDEGGNTNSVGADLAEVVAVGAVDDDDVGLVVARKVRVGPTTSEVDVEGVQAGRGLVVDGDGVGAAAGGEVDLLHASQVHGDAVDVAGEAGARAVGREVEPLRLVRADE